MKRKVVEYKEARKKVEKDGWFWVRTAGSHHQFKHSYKKGTLTIPYSKKDIPLGTLRSIEKQAGIRF